MHSGPAKHLSDLLTFVEAKVDESSGEMASATRTSAVDEIDPSSDDFPDDQVRPDAAEEVQIESEFALSPKSATMSKYETCKRDRMLKNVLRMFFLNRPNGPADFSKSLLDS